MGCCESKLLGIQDSEDKYQAGPVQLNEHFQGRRADLVKIGLHGQRGNQDRSSLCTMRSGLEQVLRGFEAREGPITTTFVKNSQKFENKTIKRLENTNQQFPPGQKQPSISSQPHTQSNISSEQPQQSQFYQNNDKILTGTSLQTRRQLQKELFYINSSQVGEVKLRKWVEEGRLGFQAKRETVGACGMHLGFFGALYLICLYGELHGIHLLVYKDIKEDLIGVRIFFNGIKRMLPLLQAETLLNSITQIPNALNFLSNECLSFWTYVLTGWIPEVIPISDPSQAKQILKRLIKNHNTGNLIVGFADKDRGKIIVVRSISMERETMGVAELGKGEDMGFREGEIGWEEVIQSYSALHVNWNPFIYSFNRKIEGISKWADGKRTTPKFILKIPSSKLQVQVRMLIQVHQTELQTIESFQLHLYESNGIYLDLSQNSPPLRISSSTSPHFLSQIFMFEQSEQPSQYILSINFNQGTELLEDIDLQVTVDLYTFCQIGAEFLKEPELIGSVQVQSEFEVSNAGFGMNSPFFNNNLQYSLSAPVDSLCKIKLQSSTPHPLQFQLCILPDRQGSQDLTLIKPEQLVREVIQSEQYEGQAQFEFKMKWDRSLIVVVCFTPTMGTVGVGVQVYDVRDGVGVGGSVEMVEVRSRLEFWKEFGFQWGSHSPGPRKRTIHNSQKIFYPISTFSKFFQNPFIDYILPQGRYQFSLISQTFASSFTAPQSSACQPECFRILNATPPSLSLGIFQLNESKSEAKIVIDDYEYVPYGIGFWTSPVELGGLYRFVFGKMEKGVEDGVFRIRRLG